MSHKMPDLIIKKVKQVPFWQVLHNDLTEDLKQDKYIKHVYRHTVKKINEVILSGKIWCDDCGKEVELKLPKNYRELTSFTLRFINRNCVFPCNDCLIKCAEDGNILGSELSGWKPDKETLRKEILGEK